jgi:cytochrome c-type biogenesis protein CcmE
LAPWRSTPVSFCGEDVVTLTEQPPLDLTPVAPTTKKSSSRRRSIVVVAVLALAVGGLLAQGLLGSLNYFKTVDEAMGQRRAIGTSEIRLEGVVERHSVHRALDGATFYLDGRHRHEVHVRAYGQPPQLFRGGIPVVVVGHFTSATSTSFVAHQIMVKHTADYVAAHPDRVRAPDGTSR